MNATENQTQTAQNENNQVPVSRDIPKCMACGYIGQWKLAPVLRGIDIVLTIALMFLGFVPGLVYLGVTLAIRSNKNRRSKICAKCKAQNMFSFLY